MITHWVVRVSIVELFPALLDNSTVVNNFRGRGRPRGKPDTRGLILTAARALFLTDGYAQTSVRAIARHADVDHTLVNYYFGSKEGLFSAVMTLTLSPSAILQAVLNHDSPRAAPSLLAAVVNIWDQPKYRLPLSRLLGEVGTSPEVRRAFSEYLEREVIARIAEQIGGPDATHWASSAGATISGLVFGRYILELDPLASMTPDQIVYYLTPALETSIRPSSHTSAR